MRRGLARLSAAIVALPAASWAAAEISPTTWLGSAKSGISAPMQIVLLLTALTLLPAALVSVTPFLRIAIVLHFLRQALGTQTAPSNQVLVGLALFLTILTMQPIARQIYEQAWAPMESGRMTAAQAAKRPPSRCASSGCASRGRKMSLCSSKSRMRRRRARRAISDLKVLIPAYILSELKAAFQIGAVLYLPFLVIDLVVASVTLSVGMMQLPPVMISAPFKILLFVLVDGWNLVVGVADEELSRLSMTADTVVEILRQALLTAFWIAAPLLAIGIRRGRGDQPGADRDFHTGYRLQHHPAADRFSGGPAPPDALDDPAHAGLHHRANRRPGTLCPLS